MENCKLCASIEAKLEKLINDKVQEMEDSLSCMIEDRIDSHLDSINWDRKIRRILVDSINDFEE